MSAENQEVCNYEKFGMCKMREHCENYHPVENCKDNNCSIVKCKKRHPQQCRFFATQEGCRFGRSCKFDHHRQMCLQELQSNQDRLLNENKHLKSNQDKLIQENRLQNQQIQILNEKIVSLEKNFLTFMKNTLVSDDTVKQFENQKIATEDVSMHERSLDDYKNELDVYKNSYHELKDMQIKVKDKPIIQTVETYQKFKENFHKNIKPWYESDDEELKATCEMFDEIYSKLIKTPKKQFKKIAAEGIQSTMNQIELLYTNVGYCRESEYDIETEDIEH